MRNINDKRHDAHPQRVMVRIHDVAAGGARAVPQAGRAEAGAVTVRGRARRGPAGLTRAGRGRAVSGRGAPRPAGVAVTVDADF